MQLLNSFARLLAIAAMLSVSAWGIGCAGETGTDEGTSPATSTPDTPAGDATMDESGSTTGGGTEAP